MSQSVYELFRKHVETRPGAPAMRFKTVNTWRDMSWKELFETTRKLSAALMAEGLQHKDRVNILANTRWEWMAADLGILGAGCTCVAIYQSNLPDEVAYIADNSGSQLMFVEDESQLDKLRKAKALEANPPPGTEVFSLKGLRRVVMFSGKPAEGDGDWVTTWDEFLKKGEAYLKDHAADVESRGRMLTPDDLICLIYTSGTTGRPKGVMLTHDNFLYEAEAVEKTALMGTDDTQLLFLPMAHVFAKVIEIAWVKMGFVLAIAESIDKLVQNMGEVKPAVMGAVPRIYERVFSKIVSGAMDAGGVKAKLFKLALIESEKAGAAEDKGEPYGGLRWAIAQALVFKKIHARMDELFGGNLRFFISGGAPLSKKIAYFFKHAGVKICEGYGLTETSAASCVNLPDAIRIGTVGPPIPGTEVKIAVDGEILIRGRGVMKGYWNNPEATREAIDADGWFHSGDIGEVDKHGFVRITDRKKDIIVTAGGKNVAPQNLENALKTNPFVSQVMIYGDKRKFLSALLTLNEENVTKWARDNGSSFQSVADLARNPKVTEQMQKVIDEFNRTVPSYESIKKFALLEKDFTVGDELTPTLKVKRKHCAQKYKQILDGFYGEDKFD